MSRSRAKISNSPTTRTDGRFPLFSCERRRFSSRLCFSLSEHQLALQCLVRRALMIVLLLKFGNPLLQCSNSGVIGFTNALFLFGNLRNKSMKTQLEKDQLMVLQGFMLPPQIFRGLVVFNLVPIAWLTKMGWGSPPILILFSRRRRGQSLAF